MNIHELKFSNGQRARDKWCKPLTNDISMSIFEYNSVCGENNFIKQADIILDNSSRQTTLKAGIVNINDWKAENEHIYIITKNNTIMKIGGTRTGLKNRWSSYCCGYYVPERVNKHGVPYPGKMSVTNAYLYHSIENDLLTTNNKWEIWSWCLPIVNVSVSILGEDIDVHAQTFHAYESICIKRFIQQTGKKPILSNNSDPDYR